MAPQMLLFRVSISVSGLSENRVDKPEVSRFGECNPSFVTLA